MKKMLFLSLILVKLFAVEITYYGAAQEVSGSMAYIKYNNFSFLVDAGAQFLEEDSDTKSENEEIDFNVSNLNSILLTHAHLDHTGRLIELYKKGFRGTIYTTKATIDLTKIMLIMQNKYLNEKRIYVYEDRGKYTKFHWNKKCSILKSISNKNIFIGKIDTIKKEFKNISLCEECSKNDLKDLFSLFKEIPFNKKFKLYHNLYAQFIPAKHIPGSSSILIYTPSKKFLFSGDLGNRMSHFQTKPPTATKADYIFVETTYGKFVRKFDVKKEYQKFIETIKKNKQKKLIWIPVFALDRLQNLI